MAVTASGLYVQNFVDELDATNVGLDLSLATHKIALLNNSATPNFDTDVTWSNTNEVTGTGWVTGGILLSAAAAGGTSTAPTVTISPAGTLMYDMNDVAVSSTTISAARAARIYADALTTPTADALILLVNFTADFATNNGTFGIQWAAGGVFALDLTP
ncbi:MAG TPA: hypothetical protein VES42_16275 [Pilimelia sp.]|nr:hypothetical protein [Pilimelia sp.]